MKEWSVKIQKFGSFLSAMVMPNIGAFIAWGLLAALFIDTGWIPNENLNSLVSPTLTYAMPILIGYTGGYNIYGKRGGVAGVLATMGVVVGSDVTMLIGGMVMGPVGAICIKKIDKLFEGKVRPGLEMLVDNFSIGIMGAVIMVVGYLAIGPVFNVILNVLKAGVNWLVNANLLPWTSIFVQPAQVLFLNNAINHGIMVPIGVEEAAETGKSILFLVEANGGTWLGLLLAFSVFGKGLAKKSAPGASIIMCFGGIGEVAFPYALSKPWTVLGPMAGNIVSLYILQLFGGGTVAAVSPGSFLALLAMTPRGCYLVNIAAYVAATAVSFLVVSFFLIRDKSAEEGDISTTSPTEAAGGSAPQSAAGQGAANVTDQQELVPAAPIKKIAFACDAGMGSSVMGVSMLKTKMQKAMLTLDLIHTPINEIPADVDVIITNVTLAQRAREAVMEKHGKSVPILTIENFLDQNRYDEIVVYLKKYSDPKEFADRPAKAVHAAPASVLQSGDVLTVNNVILGSDIKDKWEAIRVCGQILVDNGYVKPEYINDMLDRERSSSVYLGNHVAIPHGLDSSEPKILKSGIAFLQVPDGVRFDDDEDEVAYMFIGIAGKGKGSAHIDLLGQIATVCSDMDNIEKLRTATDKQQVVDLLMGR